METYYPQILPQRYLPDEDKEVSSESRTELEWLSQIAKVRGCLLKGGEPDYGKAAAIVIDDFRSGRLGRITLEFPPEEMEESCEN